MHARNALGLGAAALALTLAACGSDTATTSPSLSQTSNGFPSGSHYNLNLIGVPKGKTADMTGNNGRRIFVPLDGNTKIYLSEGDFAVLDANGTDGRAEFQLPAADPTNSGVTTYSVFARALGKPGGSSTTRTCATDKATGELWCSVEAVTLQRKTGKSTATNVSRELLYIYYDADGDGKAERYPLFDARMQDFFWAYDNSGLKLVQLRFYPCSTNVETGSTACFK